MLGLFTSHNLRSDLVKSTKHGVWGNCLSTRCPVTVCTLETRQAVIVKKDDHTDYSSTSSKVQATPATESKLCPDYDCTQGAGRPAFNKVRHEVSSLCQLNQSSVWKNQPKAHLQTASGEINLTALQDCNHKQWPHSWFMVAECYAYCRPHRVKPL